MSSPNTPDQRDNDNGQNAASGGTLDEGYGESQERAEDRWSEERYRHGPQQINAQTLDEGEPHIEGRASDIGRMVGGIMGKQETSEQSPDQPQE